MNNDIDLTRQACEIVRAVLRQHLPKGCKVWVFGSRAKHTAHRYSDLDLALKWHQPLPEKTLAMLKDAFNEARLAFSVDVVDLQDVEPSFRALLEPQMKAFDWDNANVPKLRFSEFSEAWKLSSLGDVTKWASGGTPSKTEPSYWNGDIPWISASSMRGNVYEKSNLNISDEGLKSGSKLAKKGSLLLLVRGSMLFKDIPVGMAGRDIAFNQDVKALSVTGANSLFLLAWFQASKNKLLHMVVGTGIGAGKLDTDELKSMPVFFPSDIEQQKIADFLTAVDKRIARLEEKKRLLTEYKKGVMQQIFSRQIRFTDDNGNPYPDWEEKAVGTFLKERKEYSSKGKNLEHVSLTVEGVVPKSERYERDFLVTVDDKQYKVTKLNDICYNPANLKFGVICRNKYGNGIFSPIYVTYEVDGEDTRFVEFLVTRNDFIQKARKYEEGTVYERMAVKPSDLKRLPVLMPCKGEQQKIADFLISIGNKIEQVGTQLEQAKVFKKGLLQQMFV